MIKCKTTTYSKDGNVTIKTHDAHLGELVAEVFYAVRNPDVTITGIDDTCDLISLISIKIDNTTKYPVGYSKVYSEKE